VVAPQFAGAGTARALIAGAGPAGDAVAAGLRDAGFDGEIVLVGAEPVAPYERPHLSKGYLQGTVSTDRLPLRPREQYRDLQVDLLLGETVVNIGLDPRTAVLESGRAVRWDRLCIATGSDARRLPSVPEAIYLRQLPQAEHLRGLIQRGERLDIVGAGFIGCEVAAVAVAKGCDVHLHEALEQPLVRVLGTELGGFLAHVHREHGVALALDVESLSDLSGTVLAAVGSEPRVALAEAAGLDVDRGIVVDELGQTSAPDVFAAGDVTRFYSPLYETQIRVEHFQTAQRQGFAVGRAMAGATEPYSEVPWFWSDQYDLNLQYAGAGLPWDETVTRGELGKPPFAVFYLRAGELIAAAGVNDHHTVARARHAMQARARITRRQLEDPGFDLRRALP
jgi:3-phenylpropionate/trans-cinnamate dioxygenase ferredoxin reductase component